MLLIKRFQKPHKKRDRSYKDEPAVSLQNLGKRHGDAPTIDGLSLQVDTGKVTALTGPSGCGKTTALRLIAGLETPDWGEIRLNGRLMSSPVSMVPAHKRSLSMVFQDLALWPHMTVRQHILFALPPGQYKKRAKTEQTEAILQLVQLPKPDCYPHQLSGGEQQRLAIARALASEPKILLMDEPFSHLDQSLKQELLAHIKRLLNRLQVTTIYVTHQWEEAVYMADSVAVMGKGKIESQCTADDFYHQQTANKDNRWPMSNDCHLEKKVIHLEKKVECV